MLLEKISSLQLSLFGGLCRRTTHNVHVDTVRRMLEGYERFVTVQSIMGSEMPEQKRQVLLQNRISQ